MMQNDLAAKPASGPTKNKDDDDDDDDDDYEEYPYEYVTFCGCQSGRNEMMLVT